MQFGITFVFWCAARGAAELTHVPKPTLQSTLTELPPPSVSRPVGKRPKPQNTIAIVEDTDAPEYFDRTSASLCQQACRKASQAPKYQCYCGGRGNLQSSTSIRPSSSTKSAQITSICGQDRFTNLAFLLNHPPPRHATAVRVGLHPLSTATTHLGAHLVRQLLLVSLFHSKINVCGHFAKHYNNDVRRGPVNQSGRQAPFQGSQHAVAEFL